MPLLDPWRSYLDVPKTLAFPSLSLIGKDGAPPILEGAGAVNFESLHRTTYTLTGVPADPSYAFRELRNIENAPYDPLVRMRLIGTASNGVGWSLGWTTPRVDSEDQAWRCFGEIDGQHVRSKPDTPPAEDKTEVAYVIPHALPAGRMLGLYVRTPGPNGPKRQREIELLGSTLQFRYSAENGVLDVIASQSQALHQPYLANWIGEPLRILFGQPIYPRLVANSSKFGLQVSIGSTPRFVPEASWAALFCAEHKPSDVDRFWDFYRKLLIYVASAKEADGSARFEANKLTAFYEEIYFAARGSRWVWALTFASAIEGLLRMSYPLGGQRPDVKANDVGALVKHIAEWQGDGRLKSSATGAVHRASKVTTILALRDLEARGMISEPELNAWDRVRNSVAHGSLVSIYSNEEEDNQLLNLSSLFHKLTHQILAKADIASDDATPPKPAGTAPE